MLSAAVQGHGTLDDQSEVMEDEFASESVARSGFRTRSPLLC